MTTFLSIVTWVALALGAAVILAFLLVRRR
jgi:hypothetical protein